MSASSELLLQQTRRRISNPALDNLEDATCELIVKNINQWKERLSLISPPMQSKVLRQLTQLKCLQGSGDMRKFELHVSALNELVNKSLTSIDLSGLMSFCAEPSKSDRLKQILETLSLVAESMNDLTVNDSAFESEPTGFYKCADEDLLRVIGSMKALTTLNVQVFAFKIKDTLNLCSGLPNLTSLNVKIAVDPAQKMPTPADVRSNLGRLKEFLFNVRAAASDNILSEEEYTAISVFRCLCVANLPGLEIFGDVFDAADPLDYSYLFLDHSGPNFVASNLRHLSVNACRYEWDVDADQVFPQVTHLTIDWIWCQEGKPQLSDARKQMLNFPSVKSLKLHRVPDKMLDLYLKRYGPGLKTLILSAEEQRNYIVTLEQISTSCPKLERLCLKEANVTDSGDPLEHFRQLKHFEWSIPCYQENAKLCNILSAQLLENVKIEGFGLDSEDLAAVTSLIQEKKILSALKSLTLNFTYYKLVNISSVIFRLVTNLLKTACAWLPNLRELCFSIGKGRFVLDYSMLGRFLQGNPLQNNVHRKFFFSFFGAVQPAQVDEIVTWFLDDALLSMIDILSDLR